jgi:hypothetical protein
VARYNRGEGQVFMLRHIVEGHSPDSMVEASLQAMIKSAVFLSETYDLRIGVLEMTSVRKAGHKVVLEVTQIPLGRREADDVKGPDAEQHSVAAAQERERKKADAVSWKRRIVEHFRRRKGTLMETSAGHRAYLTEIQLMGEIENEFRAATNPSSLPLPDPSAVQASRPAERVDDKTRSRPLNEIVEDEFAYAVQADEEGAPETHQPDPPKNKPSFPREEPE